MIDELGNPHLVDWFVAIIDDKEFSLYPFTIIYIRFVEDDFNAVTKL
jgi:hypothetical protein